MGKLRKYIDREKEEEKKRKKNKNKNENEDAEIHRQTQISELNNPVLRLLMTREFIHSKVTTLKLPWHGIIMIIILFFFVACLFLSF